MFGVSLTELAVVLVVALVVLGPQRLPTLLHTLGRWLHQLRKLTSEMRAQTGIDELLRQEGFHGGLAELRQVLRADPRALLGTHEPGDARSVLDDPYGVGPVLDETRERPPEGPDAYGAIPEDLLEPEPPLAGPTNPPNGAPSESSIHSSDSPRNP